LPADLLRALNDARREADAQRRLAEEQRRLAEEQQRRADQEHQARLALEREVETLRARLRQSQPPAENGP
jgi:hypothetical protein